jgi:hypothetical protein
MTKALSFTWCAPSVSRAVVRVVLVQEGRLLAGASLPAAQRKALEAWRAASSYEGAAGTVAWPQAEPSVLLAGIGKKSEFHAARWVRTWAAAGRALAKAKTVPSRRVRMAGGRDVADGDGGLGRPGGGRAGAGRLFI